MTKIRVLVVDDSAFLRRTLPRILEADPEIEVVGTAENGEEGLRAVKALRPDVVTLDVMMPVMDGLTALRHIMREAPTPVVMVSSMTREGDHETLEALACGAVDFVTKPSGPISLDIEKVSAELVEKVKAARGVRPRAAERADDVRDRFRSLSETLKGLPTRDKPPPNPFVPLPPRAPGEPTPVPVRGGRRLVAIATSTGGPAALQSLIPSLPADLDAGIVIVQHIAAGFTKPLAERLDSLSAIKVREAADGDAIVPGVALIAPAETHIMVDRANGKLVARVSAEPANATFRPSANILFRSIAARCADVACAVIMTGMGDDGALGMRSIYEAGGYTIAQDEATSLIYGMPRWAVELGGVCLSLPLHRIANEIVRSTLPPKVPKR